MTTVAVTIILTKPVHSTDVKLPSDLAIEILDIRWLAPPVKDLAQAHQSATALNACFGTRSKPFGPYALRKIGGSASGCKPGGKPACTVHPRQK